MTALDKVFIRAYGKSAKVQQPAETHVASSPPPGRRIDEAHSSSALVGPHQGAHESVSPAPERVFQPPDQGRIDARHETPAPHWTVPAGADLVGRGSVEPAPEPGISVVEEHQGASAAATEPMRAAFEVDRFLWPDQCQRLLSGANWSEISREISAAAREGQQVFLITSQHRGEGRTTLALCLAQRLAEKQLRVTLVDADFRQPMLARQLKLLPACTWDDVLRGPLPLTESWIESVEDGVTLLPLKERADTTGLTGNPRLKEQMSLLRSMSDVVLIDAGSLEDFTDREVIALLGGTAQIDGALIVRDVRKTAVAELPQSSKCLDSLGISRVDVVENFVR